jgi:hypothetical protein
VLAIESQPRLPPQFVPEPGSLLLIGTGGAIALAAFGRRQRS